MFYYECVLESFLEMNVVFMLMNGDVFIELLMFFRCLLWL